MKFILHLRFLVLQCSWAFIASGDVVENADRDPEKAGNLHVCRKSGTGRHCPGPGGIASSVPALIFAVPTALNPTQPASWIVFVSSLCVSPAGGWVASAPGLKQILFHIFHVWESLVFRAPAAEGLAFRHGWCPITHTSFSLCHFPLSPLEVVLSPSTFLELCTSRFFPVRRHFLLQLFHTQMDISLSSICPILLPRHNHVHIIGMLYPAVTNALQRTACTSKAEGERKASTNFKELLAVPCVSVSAVTTIPPQSCRNLGCVTDSGLGAPTQSTPLVQATMSHYLISRHFLWVTRLLINTKHMLAVKNSVLKRHSAAKPMPLQTRYAECFKPKLDTDMTSSVN